MDRKVYVKLIVGRASTSRVWSAGDVIQVGEAEAERMEAAGQCERLEAEPEIEKATKRRGKEA